MDFLLKVFEVEKTELCNEWNDHHSFNLMKHKFQFQAIARAPTQYGNHEWTERGDLRLVCWFVYVEWVKVHKILIHAASVILIIIISFNCLLRDTKKKAKLLQRIQIQMNQVKVIIHNLFCIFVAENNVNRTKRLRVDDESHKIKWWMLVAGTLL